MYAVIKTGGKQYRVAEDQVIQVEKIKAEPGQIVQLSDVLMLGGEAPQIGTPTVAGASVAAEVLEQSRGPKIIAFKKRRRKNSRRKRGHRQEFTLLRITEILTEGRAPSKPARGKEERQPKPEAPEAEGQVEAAGETEGTTKAAKPKAKVKPKADKKPPKGKGKPKGKR
ncbi:MAG TPA: 50S ribosomal protein L21 [Xanthobacteraceae bacterium]|nr:50S ribosomal protein L21 [Xanthobacteraceae bacterium]